MSKKQKIYRKEFWLLENLVKYDLNIKAMNLKNEKKKTLIALTMTASMHLRKRIDELILKNSWEKQSKSTKTSD